MAGEYCVDLVPGAAYFGIAFPIESLKFSQSPRSCCVKVSTAIESEYSAGQKQAFQSFFSVF